MYCANCGQALNGSVSVCPSCGARVEETGASSTSNFPASPVLNASESQLETTEKFKPYFFPNLVAALLGCANVFLAMFWALEMTQKFKPYYILSFVAAFLCVGGNASFWTGAYFASVAKSSRRSGRLDEARLKAKVAKILFWQGLGWALLECYSVAKLGFWFVIAAH